MLQRVASHRMALRWLTSYCELGLSVARFRCSWNTLGRMNGSFWLYTYILQFDWLLQNPGALDTKPGFIVARCTFLCINLLCPLCMLKVWLAQETIHIYGNVMVVYTVVFVAVWFCQQCLKNFVPTKIDYILHGAHYTVSRVWELFMLPHWVLAFFICSFTSLQKHKKKLTVLVNCSIVFCFNDILGPLHTHLFQFQHSHYAYRQAIHCAQSNFSYSTESALYTICLFITNFCLS